MLCTNIVKKIVTKQHVATRSKTTAMHRSGFRLMKLICFFVYLMLDGLTFFSR